LKAARSKDFSVKKLKEAWINAQNIK